MNQCKEHSGLDKRRTTQTDETSVHVIILLSTPLCSLHWFIKIVEDQLAQQQALLKLCMLALSVLATNRMCEMSNMH